MEHKRRVNDYHSKIDNSYLRKPKRWEQPKTKEKLRDQSRSVSPGYNLIDARRYLDLKKQSGSVLQTGNQPDKRRKNSRSPTPTNISKDRSYVKSHLQGNYLFNYKKGAANYLNTPKIRQGITEKSMEKSKERVERKAKSPVFAKQRENLKVSGHSKVKKLTDSSASAKGRNLTRNQTKTSNQKTDVSQSRSREKVRNLNGMQSTKSPSRGNVIEYTAKPRPEARGKNHEFDSVFTHYRKSKRGSDLSDEGSFTNKIPRHYSKSNLKTEENSLLKDYRSYFSTGKSKERKSTPSRIQKCREHIPSGHSRPSSKAEGSFVSHNASSHCNESSLIDSKFPNKAKPLRSNEAGSFLRKEHENNFVKDTADSNKFKQTNTHSTNTYDESKALNKEIETVEEIHFKLVNIFQGSKSVVQIEDLNDRKENLFSTVTKCEERDL